MMSSSKVSAIHSSSATYCSAGESSSPKAWCGGQSSSEFPPSTAMFHPCFCKNTAKNCLTCAMSGKNFIWEENEMKFCANAIKSLTLKISETHFIHLI